MLIDWFTVIAQVVNFLILVWLLKRFLYTPILNAIDAREMRIAGELAAADAMRTEAQKERDAFRHNNEEFDRQRASLFSEAILNAGTERKRILEEARKEAEDMRARQIQTFRNDYGNLKEEIVRRTRDEVFAIARKTLSDLASANLEGYMVDVFIRRCRALREVEKNALQSAFKASMGSAVVRSTFPLSAEQRSAIERVSQEVFFCKGDFRFETSPDLVSGLELSMDGHEVSWSIADYLLALEKNVGDPFLGEFSGEEKLEARNEEPRPGNGAGHGS
jgi:F-type H+-transporting ATPase subunit b